VREVKEPALKSPVIGKSFVKECPPARIGKVPVHRIARSLVEGPTYAMALDYPTGFDQVLITISHPILIGHGARHGSETESHVIAKMDGVVPRQQGLQCLRSTEVEWIEKSAA
jgi:hypothetical protein